MRLPNFRRESQRIAIRPLQLRDLDHVMAWVNDPRVVKNFQRFDQKITRAEEKRFLLKLMSSPNDAIFSIFDTEGAYLGQGGINQISWENKLGRLSIFIMPAFWNQGYAREAIRLLLGVAFSTLKLRKVWLMAWATNLKAMHIYKSVGFSKEGVLRDEYFWRGKYHDIVRMGILRSEYRSSRL